MNYFRYFKFLSDVLVFPFTVSKNFIRSYCTNYQQYLRIRKRITKDFNVEESKNFITFISRKENE